MSFLRALSNVAFWAYTLTALGILLAGWGLLFWLQRRGQRLDEAWRLFWSWVVLVVVVSPAVLLGGEVFALVVALASLFACKEFARATGLYEDWMFTGLVYVAIVVVNT